MKANRVCIGEVTNDCGYCKGTGKVVGKIMIKVTRESYNSARVRLEKYLEFALKWPILYANHASVLIANFCNHYRRVMSQEELFEWRMIGVIVRREFYHATQVTNTRD